MVAMAASPTPNSTAAPSKAHDHPPYKEMIIRALESLKDRKGSSKTAIAKYIASNYFDLPPTHDALLATHLRRLKRNGIIKMVKHSYKLLSPTTTAVDSSIAPIVGPKKRGRPPKNLTPVAPGIVKHKPGRPRKEGIESGKNLTDKRKPGRPRKVLSNVMQKPKPKPKTVEPMPGEKRRPGRPKKASAVAVESVGGSNALAPVPFLENSLLQDPTSIEDGGVDGRIATLGEKKKGVRPKKEAGGGLQPSATTKKRGRPPKEKDLAVPMKMGSETKRSVGRPRKNVEA